MNFIKKWLGKHEWGSKARKEQERSKDRLALDRWLIEDSLSGEDPRKPDVQRPNSN